MLTLGGLLIEPVGEARSLSLFIDKHLRFKTQINNLIKKGFYNLRLIYQNNNVLDRSIRRLLCKANVSSYSNHCDIVYGACIDANDALRLQRLQNTCLRLIYGVPRSICRTSNKLVDANWLNMENRRLIITLLHVIPFHNYLRAPQYLRDKFKYSPIRL